jgi:hypothetical protein
MTTSYVSCAYVGIIEYRVQNRCILGWRFDPEPRGAANALCPQGTVALDANGRYAVLPCLMGLTAMATAAVRIVLLVSHRVRAVKEEAPARLFAHLTEKLPDPRRCDAL